MKIIFVGVGEAFDENRPNTSILVLGEAGNDPVRILFDCGFTAAHAFWRLAPDPTALDAVWISHFHGDHFLGLPLLLLRFWEEKRTRPLTIIGQEGVTEKVPSAMDLAYPGFYEKLTFPVKYVTAQPGQELDLLRHRWSFAAGRHSQPCLGIRLAGDTGSVYYSGDGQPSDGTAVLARGCDLVIHEAYGRQAMLAAHGSVDGSIEFARHTGAGHLALVHMNRRIREEHASAVRRQLAGLPGLHAFLPAPGDSITIGASAPETAT